jgi:hypothetical protein
MSATAERSDATQSAPALPEAEPAPPLVTRLMFAPVKLAARRVAPRLSRRLYMRLWSLIDSEDPPPRAEDRQASVGRLAMALALEGACAAIVSGLLEQISRRKFARLTGRWPSRRAKS